MTALWILPGWAGAVAFAVWAFAAPLAAFCVGVTVERCRFERLWDYERPCPGCYVKGGHSPNCPYLIADTARKYRLAWLSARRRAHRGRLLAELLREPDIDRCPDCGGEITSADHYGGGREYACTECDYVVVFGEDMV